MSASLGHLEPNEQMMITSNQIVTVVFSAKINALPTPPQIVNKSQVEFSYYVDPNGTIITNTIFSNNVTTSVVQGQLNAVKSVDKTIATLQDVLTYKVVLTNTGNTAALQVQFQDTPSTGATFTAGSVIINGTPRTDLDPTVGFNLGDIGVGNTVTVQFQATVTSVPPTNIVTNQAVLNFSILVDPKQPPINQTSYSNTTTTNIVLGHLSVVKSVDKQFATIGDTLTYTIVITNTGNINVTNVVFIDPTPQHAIFVIGSVVVNGVNQPTYNPAAGFPLNTMTPGHIITVVYQVQIISEADFFSRKRRDSQGITPLSLCNFDLCKGSSLNLAIAYLYNISEFMYKKTPDSQAIIT